MKKIIFFLFAASSITFCTAQNIGIGTNSPSSSAMLDVNSTTKGLLIPRMTSAQRSAIASPVNGLMVYDITTNSFWYYNNSAWTNLSAGGGGETFSFPLDTTLALPGTTFRIINSGNGIQGGSINGSGVIATSTSGAGLTASSANSYGIVANSSARSAIYAYNNNAYPAIDANNSNPSGVAINANAANYHAIKGVTGGTGKSGIWGEATGLGGNGVYGTSSSDQGYGVYGYNLTGTGVYGSSNTGTGLKAVSNSGIALDVNGKLKIAGGNTNPSDGAVLTSDLAGNAVWKNNQIAFSAKGVNSNYTGIAHNTYTKVHFNQEEYDFGNDYVLHVGTNPTSISSTFTIPVTGVYHFDSFVRLHGNDQHFKGGDIRLVIDRAGTIIPVATGIDRVDNYYSGFSQAQSLIVMISKDVRLLANDKVWIEVLHNNEAGAGASISTVATENYFNGHLVIAK